MDELALASFGLLYSKMPSSKDLRAITKNNADTVEALSRTNAQLKEINQEMKSLNLNIQQQNRLIQEGIDIAKESLVVQKYIALQQDRDRIYNRQKEITKHSLEQQSKFLREAFFQLKKELDVIEKSENSNLKKYYSIEAIEIMLKQHKISTKLTDDLFEKQLIQDSFNQVKEIKKNTEKKLTNEDKSDIKLVTMIMTDIEFNKLLDQKNKIKSISSSHEKNIKNLKETQDFADILKTYPEIVIKIN